MTTVRRSPVKGRPLRLPGQSLSEERERIFEDKMLMPMLAAILLVAWAAMEWWRYLAQVDPSPWIATAAAAIAVAFTGWRIHRWRPHVRHLRQAMDGELVVGEYLGRLREQGYEVFHDLLGDGFNVDHVIIGPAGIFTVETKTWSKPARGEPTINFDGEHVLAAGYEPDRNPVTQAKAQAAWLRQVVEEISGRRVQVRPVVLFPGWFVRQSGSSTREVWVLEPKALKGFLAHEPAKLPPEEVRLISTNLSRYIRAGEAIRRQM